MYSNMFNNTFGHINFDANTYSKETRFPFPCRPGLTRPGALIFVQNRAFERTARTSRIISKIDVLRRFWLLWGAFSGIFGRQNFCKISGNRPRRAILRCKIQCFVKIALKNAFGSDIVSKRDLAKTIVKRRFWSKMVLPDASGGVPESLFMISGAPGAGKPTCTKPS